MTLAVESVTSGGLVRPPECLDSGAPVSREMMWIAVVGALRDQGDRLVGPFDHDQVTNAATAVTARHDWEVTGAMVASGFSDVVADHRRRQAACTTTDETGFIPPYRTLLKQTRDFLTYTVLRRSVPYPDISAEELAQLQNRQDAERRLATPAPEVGESDWAVATAALACQAVSGRTEIAREVAADVLFDKFPDMAPRAAELAGALAAPAQPVQ